MNRAEMRRQAKEQAKANTTTYNFTKGQLDDMLRAAEKKGFDDGIDHAFLYMIGVPLNVLYNDYWPKSAKARAPKFVEECLKLYESLQNGIVSEQQIKDLIEELSGVTVEASWLK